MADWKDFYEDNKETFGQYLDSLTDRRRSSSLEHASAAPLQFCPICHAVHISSADLDIHIKQVHGPQHVYLRVNGQIVRNIGWAERGVSELRVVLLGFPSASVQVSGIGFCQQTSSGDRDFRRLVPARYEGEIHVDVSPEGGKPRQFMLFSRSLPEFRREDLDALVLRWAGESAPTSDPPDVGRWRQLAGKMGDLEKRYLDGFFEYALAFYLSSHGQADRAKEHLEEAFGLLLPFRTPLAHSAQCVLGLAMNCFGVLNRATRGSLLSASDVFFNQPFGQAWDGPIRASNGRPFLTLSDEFTIRLVRVVADFYDHKEHNLFAAGLSALEFHPLAAERNNHDKLALLRARRHRRMGQPREARAAYEMLRYHPFFGAEAESFLNG